MFDSQSGAYLGCKFDPQWGVFERELIDVSFSLSPSLLSSLYKSMKAISLGKDFFFFKMLKKKIPPKMSGGKNISTQPYPLILHRQELFALI